MQFNTLALTAVLGLSGQAAAFWGQMIASDYHPGQDITIVDYNTGSSYTGSFAGFNSCVGDNHCHIDMFENNNGGYNFGASIWRSNDGCHHFNFLGALDVYEGWCCGGLPCDFSASSSPCCGL